MICGPMDPNRLPRDPTGTTEQHDNLGLTMVALVEDVPERRMLRAWQDSRSGVGHVVETMHERKLQMFERADAFVVLPGGIGTLEELFEVLSWRTLGLHTKPIVIVDQGGYWSSLAALLRAVVEGGFAERRHLDHVAFVSDLKEILPAIAAMPRETGPEPRLDRV